MLKNMESSLRCRAYFAIVGESIGSLQVIFASEKQCAADSDCGAVDARAIVES